MRTSSETLARLGGDLSAVSDKVKSKLTAFEDEFASHKLRLDRVILDDAFDEEPIEEERDETDDRVLGTFQTCWKLGWLRWEAKEWRVTAFRFRRVLDGGYNVTHEVLLWKRPLAVCSRQVKLAGVKQMPKLREAIITAAKNMLHTAEGFISEPETESVKAAVGQSTVVKISKR